MKQKICLFFCIFLLSLGALYGQSVAFDVENLLAYPPVGNWMFDLDGTPYDFNQNAANYAYQKLSWHDGTPINGNLQGQQFVINPPATTSVCSAENTDLLPNTDNVEIEFIEPLVLTAFNHVNTVNVANAWNTIGQAGDFRIYTGGKGLLKVNGVVKLTVDNLRITMTTPYPTQAQLQQQGFNVPHDIGTGMAIEADGWGSILVAESDPAWVAEFDNGAGQLEFNLSSFSSVIQQLYGLYDFNIELAKPAPVNNEPRIEEILAGPFGGEMPQMVDWFNDAGLSFDFSLVDYFDEPASNEDIPGYLTAIRVEDKPFMELPTGIDSIRSEGYWRIGSTLEAFTTTISFDLSWFDTIPDLSSVRILRKNTTGGIWEIYDDFDVISTNPPRIRVNNVSQFSDWGVGIAPTVVIPTQTSYYVSPLGSDATGTGTIENPFRTITFAHDTAADGDTINVLADEQFLDVDFTENLTITKQLTFIGHSSMGLKPTITPTDDSQHIFKVTVDNVVFNGITLYGTSLVSGKSAIYINQVSNTLVTNCNFGPQFGSETTCYGITLYRAYNNSVENNDFLNCGTGIAVKGASYNFIHQNNFDDSSNYHIHLDDSPYQTGANHNYITGNTFTADGTAINLESYCDYNNISGNTFTSMYDSVMWIYNSDSSIIAGNVVDDTRRSLYIATTNYPSNNNLIFLNNFANDSSMNENVSVVGGTNNSFISPVKLSYLYNGEYTKGYLGNYYDDYEGNDADTNGIGDDAHVTGGDQNDTYPMFTATTNYEIFAWWLKGANMYKGNMAKKGEVISIPANSSKIFTADNIGSVRSFSLGNAANNTTWAGQITFNQAPALNSSYIIKIGYADNSNGDNFWEDGPQANIIVNGTDLVYTFNCDAIAFDVPEGKLLAMKVVNNNIINCTIKTGGAWSFVSASMLNANIEVPQNVSISVDANNVTLTWDEVAGATNYKVYSGESVDNLDSFVEITNDGNLDVNNRTFTIDRQTQGVYKYYMVKAVN